MKSKSVYTAIAFILVVALFVTGLEVFSTYPVNAVVYNTKAPVQTIQSITIDARPEKIWNILTDVNRWSEWEKDNKDPLLKGSFKAGNSFTWKSKGLSIRSDIKVAAPYRYIAWSGPAFGVFAIHTWQFTPLEDGSTRVEIRESMEGWLVSLMPGKFQEGLDKSLENWLVVLKKRAEQ